MMNLFTFTSINNLIFSQSQTKQIHHKSFYHIVLLLSGDTSSNPPLKLIFSHWIQMTPPNSSNYQQSSYKN